MIFRKRPVPHPMILEESWPVRRRNSLWKRLMWLILIALLCFLGIDMAYSQENPDIAEPPPFQEIDRVESGQLLMKTAAGNYQPAVHLTTRVHTSISGMVARVTYSQSFKNDSDQWSEAVYLFPLSENAAVNEMEMIIGERIIRSEIHEKAEAQRIYTQAKQAGKKAALTEQQRPNMFTQKVANIAPGETIQVRLQYIQRLDYDNGVFSFYLPTTITPRFIPGIPQEEFKPNQHLETNALGWARPTDQVPDAHRITPPMLPVPSDKLLNPIRISIDLEPGFDLADIRSRNHQIRQTPQGNGYHLELGPVSMDRDFRLEWQPTPSALPRAAVFQEEFAGEDYALLMLLPPQAEPENIERLPREIIYILDTSGSMGGDSIRQAKQSLLLALERMKPDDRFNLIEFNSDFRALFPGLVDANYPNLTRAKSFVQMLQANGGTNMAPALEHALDMPGSEGYLKQLVFITDGAVGNEEALFSLIESRLGNARLFTVGIGSAPNSYFMTRAAQFGRGTYEFVSNGAEVQERMSNLFRKLESPVLGDLQVRWQLTDHSTPEQFPGRIPDLYAGEPLILSAKADQLEGSVKIIGSTGEAPWTRTLALNPGSSQQSGIGTIWAKAKVESLMDEKSRGRDEADVRADILAVALPHKLITAYTSLVAVEEKISRTAEDRLNSSAVPNAVAEGQHLQPQSYPQTASWMPLYLWLGSLCLLLSLVLSVGMPRGKQS